MRSGGCVWLKIIYRWLENTVHIWWLRCLLRFKASALYIYSSMADHAWKWTVFRKEQQSNCNSSRCRCRLAVTNCALGHYIYIKCIIQTAYKRHKKGIKGYSPELQRKRADVLLKSQSPSWRIWPVYNLLYSRSIYWDRLLALVLKLHCPRLLKGSVVDFESDHSEFDQVILAFRSFSIHHHPWRIDHKQLVIILKTTLTI